MYGTIDQVVRAAIAEKGYRTLHKYVLYLHFALDGLYRVKRDGVLKSRKTVLVKVNSRKAVPWPKDMLWYGRIGIPVAGRILTFIPDNSLSLDPDDHVAETRTGGSALVSGSGQSFGLQELSELFYSNGTPVLAGSHIAKRFRVNEDQREFQLDSTMTSGQIVLEYITNGLEPNSETIISHHASMPLKEWIHYRESRFKAGAAAAETVASNQDYLHELDQSLAAQSDLSYNGIMDALSAGMLASF